MYVVQIAEVLFAAFRYVGLSCFFHVPLNTATRSQLTPMVVFKNILWLLLATGGFCPFTVYFLRVVINGIGM